MMSRQPWRYFPGKLRRGCSLWWAGGLLILWLILGCFSGANAQTTTLQDTLQAQTDTLQLARKNLLPFSEVVRLDGQRVDTSAYTIDYWNGQFILKDSALLGRELTLRYQAFDAQFQPRIRLRERERVTDEATQREYYYSEDDFEDREAINQFSMGRLTSNGSLSRAITVGTNRDLAVNSDFRLQLEGELADDLEIVAAITDQNIPIQPSGTTQQLSDFDRVFIQLRRRNLRLTFGDFEVTQQNTRFANIYRNVLGVNLAGKGQYVDGNVSLTVSKGRFHTNSFSGENSKQGPYRLTGRNNERFIIILAGSEKVYVNGKRMQRGEDRDYVIEYNTGEITFTANRLITNNTRIVVDFEYADRNYSRSLLFAQGGTKLGKNDRFQLRVSYGREADNPNAPIDLELEEGDRRAIAQAGDDPLAAVVSGIDTIPFEQNEIFYKQVDTVVNGITYPDVLVYSTDSTQQLFRVFYTNVGPGNGNYVQEASLINGNIFRWVAPGPNGEPRGSYLPVRVLPLPKLLQVVNVGASYQFSKHLKLINETSYSTRDENRLSAIDDSDNEDLAQRTGLQLRSLPLGGDFRLDGDVAVQYVGGRYNNFDRVYEKEYGREWNYNDLGARATERIGEAGLGLKYSDDYALRSDMGLRSYGDSLRTLRNVSQFTGTDSAGLFGNHKFSWIQTENILNQSVSTWIRNEGDLSTFIKKKLQVGSEIWLENRRDEQADSILGSSFAFYDLKPYVRYVAGNNFQGELSFNYRYDRGVIDSTLVPKSLTLSPAAKFTYRPFQQLRIQNATTYMDFEVLDTAFSSRENLLDQRNFLTNLQVAYNTKNRFLRTNVLYEVLSEQVARRQEVYVEVNPGQGQYEWIDYNEDGVQDLDEFQLAANPLTANFIKILAPTNELFPAVTLRGGWAMQTNLKYLLPEMNTFLGKLARNVSTVTSFRTEQKRQLEDLTADSYVISLEQPTEVDSSLLNSLFNFRQEVFFFRNSPNGDFSFGLNELKARQFLSSGNERRFRRTWTAKQRYNFSNSQSIENVLETGFLRNTSELIQSRTYNINFFGAQPVFNYQVNRRVRLSGGYAFSWKENLTDSLTLNANLISHKVIFDSRFSFGGRNNLMAKLELFQMNLTGQPNTNARFELLEGNQPGRNAIWNIYLTYFVTKSLELSIIYDGRAAENRSAIHSARMQLRAIF